jgi:pimeloyl-ACP methyl ester carboxylesterase
MTSIVDGTWLCGAETLSVRQYLSQGGGLPILVLHGAGNAEQSRLAHLCEAFAKLGHTSVSFDFSGHGKSTAITAGSLQKRVIEAEQVANQYITSDFYIAAFSMSGHVAVHLTKILRVKGLLLFSPGSP